MSQQEVPKLVAIEGGRSIAARDVQAEFAKQTEELSFVTREKLNEVHRTARLWTAQTRRCELSEEDRPCVGQKLLSSDTEEVGTG
jgi:hypothetical protein